MKIKNISKQTQCVPNVPAFTADEERTVTAEEADVLLANPNFAMSKSSSQERREKSVKEAGGETKKVTGKDEEEGLDL